ncbi:hypothetical protein [Coraliomargarita parva]|uniref:hypothetical protein n=1 Tax=Coraliomargarita parva TaxID=3014050 RepID=UPI0022B383AE|nr:hypothetical protein [Coraliomargarita parva]
MSVSREELIAINGLLIQREAAYARVGGIERAINDLLGADYPFDVPEAIPPSLVRRKTVKRKAPAKDKSAELKLRRLKEDECAYRFTWTEHGQRQTRVVTDLRNVDAFIKCPLPGMKLLKVETLDLNSKLVDCLFEV